MRRYQYHICSFSTPVADLKRKDRTSANVLRAIADDPRVSTFDMSEHYKWLPDLVYDLVRRGLLRDESEMVEFPWHRFTLTPAGRSALEAQS